MAASEVLASVGRLTERSAAGPGHQAAAYDRAARGLRRLPPVPNGPGRRTRRAAGGLRGMAFVRRADTRKLLQLVEQLSALSLSLAALREQQGRAAQAAAARQAAQMLAAEQIRRSHAAYASVHGLTATSMSPTTGSSAGRIQSPGSDSQHTSVWPGRPAGPAPASRPGRTR